MSPQASGSVRRRADARQTTESENHGPAGGPAFPTGQEPPGGPIGLPGANTEPVSEVRTVAGTVFRSGTPKRGGFGKIRSTASSPCPACGGIGCSYSDDRSLLVCWRSAGESKSSEWQYRGPGSSGGSVFVLAGSSDASLRAKLEHLDRERLTGSTTWAALVERYLRDPHVDEERRRLALELGVDVWSLAGLSVGWKPGAYGVGAWTYPQRTARGDVVSIGLRIDREDDRQRYDHNGKSKSPPGVILVPGRWLTATGPVLVVEGMTDTAALDTLRLDVVGHPGHTPKGPLLDELETLLRAVPADREIIRLADRESGREDDEAAPGRTGARKTAQALATRLGRRVGVSLAPDGAKDSRAWVRERWSPAVTSCRDALRDEYVEKLVAGVVWYQPEDRVDADVIVEPLAPSGDELSLEEYRGRMRSAVETWAKDDRVRGRIAVLAAPAGSGKTTAVDELALPLYDRWANAVPTHANCAERRSTLQSLPIIDVDVAAYPRLDESTCVSFTDEQVEQLRAQGNRGAVSAQRAQSRGFGVRATACRGCPLAPWKETGVAVGADVDLAAFAPEVVFTDDPRPADADDEFSSIRCSYWRGVARAEAARGKVATLDRVRLSGARMLDAKDERSLLVLDERGFETLAPTMIVNVHALESLAEGLRGSALRIEAETGRPEVTKPPRKGRSPSSVDGLFDTAQDREDRRRWRDTARESEKKRAALEERNATRRADQIEHLGQLATVAEQLAARLRAKADAESWGVESVEIVRERGRRQSERLAKDEESRVETALEEVVATIDGDPAATKVPRVPLVVRGRAVKQPARLLADALERSLPAGAEIQSEALELVRRVHAGRADLVAIHVDPIDGDGSRRAAGGERRVRMSVLATWTTRLPDAADVLVLDGTLDVPALAKRIGRPDVEIIGPTGSIRRSTFAAQLPADVSRGSAIRTVAKTIERGVAALPECRSVGIIMLSDHRQRAFPRDKDGNDIRTPESRELIPDDVLRRIARDEDGRLLVEHFGGGRDRASNVWIEHCDGLIILGTPRPCPTAVVAELVRRLDVEALERGSDWGRRDWDGRTLDGRRVRCHGRGYIDPAWAAAAAAVTRTTLRQALERARTVVPTSDGSGARPGGIPVIVVSGEGGLDLPVIEDLPAAVSRGARRVEEVVRTLVGSVSQVAGENPGSLGAPGSDPEGSPISLTGSTREIPLLVESVRLIAGPTVRSREVVEELLREKVDGRLPARATVFRWIAEAESVGLIVRSGSTRATVYGLPTPVDIPDAVAEPAVAGPGVVDQGDTAYRDAVILTAPDRVPDWEIDEAAWADAEIVPATGPPDPLWSPASIEGWSTWAVPTGPAAA